jgi:hypothetical protein
MGPASSAGSVSQIGLDLLFPKEVRARGLAGRGWRDLDGDGAEGTGEIGKVLEEVNDNKQNPEGKGEDAVTLQLSP